MNQEHTIINPQAPPVLRKELSIMLGMLILLCLVVFHKFILGTAIYLFKDIGSDTLNFYYPAFVNISGMLQQAILPGWSFEQGLGQNVFPFSLSDPTTYLLYFLGSERLPFGLIWMEIFKLIGSGLLFFCLLKKLQLETHAAYLGGMLYAFSGFMIVGSGWYIFSSLGLYTALVLLAFEMLYQEKKWWLFPISISLVASYNFVSLYTCGAFLLLYALFRTCGAEQIDLKKLKPLFTGMLLFGALGVLMSAVFSLPNLLQMESSPRVSGEASLARELFSMPIFELGNSHYLATLLMRSFSNDLLGNGSLYKGWNNYLEAPLNYCGLISLLLVPQVFPSLRPRQKMLYGLFIGGFILAEIFPWFRRGFWLFQGDYFRDFSLYFSITLILFSTLALDKIIKRRKINFSALAMTLATLLLLLYFPWNIHFQNGRGETVKWDAVINHGLQAKIALLLIFIALNLSLFSVKKGRQYVQISLLALTFVELAALNHDTVNQREALTTAEISKKTGYNDHSIEALAFIRQQDKDFFRVEKNYGSAPTKIASLNDSKVQHYFGTSSYTSFNQLNYINFLSASGALNANIEKETRWAFGVKNEVLLQILTGVRYFLFKGNWQSYPELANAYSEAARFDDVTVLKSKYALPMGVAYDTYIAQSDFSKLDAPRKHQAMLKALVIPDDRAAEFPDMNRISGNEPDLAPYNPDELARDTEKLKANSFHIQRFANNAFDGDIQARIKQLVFFSFPFDEGWEAKVNGEKAAILMVDGGLSAVPVGPGRNIITLRYTPPFVKTGLLLTLLGLVIFVAMLFRYTSRCGTRCPQRV